MRFIIIFSPSLTTFFYFFDCSSLGEGKFGALMEGKRVKCEDVEGVVHGDEIVCDCCKQSMLPSSFEAHGGKGRSRNPYWTITVADTGLPLHTLRESCS